MRALVLAAGVGSRLRPYTDRTPKPMLPIGGKPILGYNLALLAAAGFRDVVVNVHHLPDVVRAFAGTGERWDMRITYSEEPVLLGTAGALLPFASDFRDETFAIVFGDNVAEIDIAAMLAHHRRRAPLATIAVWSRDDVSQSGVAELDEHDRITRFIEKPPPGATGSHWVNAGIVIAEPALLDFLPQDGPSDLGRDVFPAILAAGETLCGYRLAGGLWWFDRPHEYRAAISDERLLAFVRDL